MIVLCIDEVARFVGVEEGEVTRECCCCDDDDDNCCLWRWCICC